MTDKKAETVKTSLRFKGAENIELLEKFNTILAMQGLNFNDYVIGLIKKDYDNTDIDKILKETETKLKK